MCTWGGLAVVEGGTGLAAKLAHIYHDRCHTQWCKVIAYDLMAPN